MNNLSDSAKKRREKAALEFTGPLPTNDKIISAKLLVYRKQFLEGFDAGRADTLKRLEKVREALIKVGAYFDCLSCESQHGYVCEHHLDERMQASREALALWDEEIINTKSEVYGSMNKDATSSIINLQSQVQLLEDALKIISRVRNTISKNGPWTIAKQALESLSQLRGGGDE